DDEGASQAVAAIDNPAADSCEAVRRTPPDPPLARGGKEAELPLTRAARGASSALAWMEEGRLLSPSLVRAAPVLFPHLTNGDQGGSIRQSSLMPPRRTALDDLRFFSRTTATALRSLRRNVMRSALTTLGIIIGVGSLLAIAEIGKGAWTAIRTLLTRTGVDNIVVQAGAASRNGVSLGSGSIKTLIPEDAEAILHECPSA